MTYLRLIIFKTTYSKLINLCLSDSINKNIRLLETCQYFTVFIFKILDYLIYTGCLMHKNGIKARFIRGSPKFSIRPLARTIINFRWFFRQIQTYNDKSRSFTGAKNV